MLGGVLGASYIGGRLGTHNAANQLFNNEESENEWGLIIGGLAGISGFAFCLWKFWPRTASQK